MEELIKERSVKSCIALGYKHWQQHLGETFRRTRWRILLSAVMFTAFIISALMGAPKWLCILLLTFSINSVSVKVRSLTGEMETAQRGKKLIKKNLGYYVYFDPSTLSTTYWVLTGLTGFATTIAVRFIDTWEDYAELYIFGTMITRNRTKRQGKA